MAKQQRIQAATNVAAQNEVVRVSAVTTHVLVKHPVANLTSRNAARIARVQALRKQKNAARAAARAEVQAQLAKKQAFQLAVQQLASQYGIDVQQQVAPRANSATVIPSANQVLVDGQYYTPCKAVHALADKHLTRKDTLAACKAAGINPATAATQYGVWKKAQAN